MSRRILFCFLAVFMLSACTTYNSALKRYERLPGPKALASAYDNENRWVVGYSYASPSVEVAKSVALIHCENGRTKRNVLSPCKVYIAHDIYSNPVSVREPTPDVASTPDPEPAPASEPASVSESSKVPVKEQKRVSYGTGFAVRSDGYILTAYHIIADADVIIVYYQNEKEIPAELVKPSSPLNDLAILKIKTKTPQYLDLEEPGKVYIGERVFTVGFPVMELLGSEPKYTEGTISSVSGPHDEASFMQISVPVQPGNSGGPLLNEQGKVVGIITATAAISRFLKTTGTLPQNINWAVKADIARTLFKAPKPSKTSKIDRQAIITRARDSVCIVGVVKSE